MDHIGLLNRHIAEGTLIRGLWEGTDAQGRQTACLLAAMVPQCGKEKSARSCPADVMPTWLAYLTPNLDDNGSIEAWPGMVKRFAGLAARWHVLDAAAWQRVQFGWLAAVVREAASHTKEPAATAICERVAVLCDGVVSTGVIDTAAFESARRAAWDTWVAAAAAAAAARAAVAAARAARAARAAAAAAEAAEAAAGAAEAEVAEAEVAAAAAAARAAVAAAEAEAEAAAAAEAAEAAAEAEAEAAAEAAEAAAEAEAEAAGAGAPAAVWDSLTVVLFGLIEGECNAHRD